MTVLAWDVGTSGVKAVVVDRTGRILASARRSYGLATGSDGRVDQDLDAIQYAVDAATRGLFESGRLRADEVEAIGLTAQMFNLAPVDAAGGSTLPMLSWLDQRAVVEADALATRIDRQGQGGLFRSIVTAKDVIPKIAWIRDREPDAWQATRWLLDCKEAIVLRLTGRAVMDPAGAMALRLYDPIAGCWSADACAAAGVPVDRLPDVEPATAIAGTLLAEPARRLGLRAGIPVVVGAGDVPASQLGAGATDPGDAHVSLGTAVYFGITVDRPVADPAGQLGVIGHADPRLWILWLEVATGGGALAWLLRALGDGAEPSSQALASLDREVGAVADEMDGLLFAPWLTGERVPVFDDRIRGAFVGLGLRHGRGHLLRALMEGVAFQMRWALEYGTAFGAPIGEIRGVGGGFIGATWTQIIADVLDRPISAIRSPQDAAAVGAAACALVGIGLQQDLRFVRDIVAVERTFRPDPARRARLDAGYARFRRLYDALAPLIADEARPAAPVAAVAAGRRSGPAPGAIAPVRWSPDVPQPLGPEPRRDVVVTYLAGLPADEGAARTAADAFALGQSLGTWKPVPGITDAMRRDHGARVVGLRRTAPDEEVAGMPAGGRWVLSVAFPLVNLGGSLAMLLTTAIGNDPSTSIALRVVAIDLPGDGVAGLPGPRFGVAGWRALTGVADRPLLLNMIKPCTGFPPEVGARFAAESARGTVDLIKDDELLADPSFSRVAERTRAYVAAIDAVTATTGRATRYVAHVTTTPRRLGATARAAVDAGAGAVMVTPLTLGLDAHAELAEDAGVPRRPPVARGAVWTGATEGGIGHGALARLLRLAGADAVLTSTPHAPRPLAAGAYAATAGALRGAVARHSGDGGGMVPAAMPMTGGGITAEHVGPIVSALGPDVIVAVGGAIQGHPEGAATGGRTLRAAIDAAMAEHAAAVRFGTGSGDAASAAGEPAVDTAVDPVVDPVEARP